MCLRDPAHDILNDQGVGNVDEEGPHQRHHDEGASRRAERLGHRGHVRDGRRRRAQCKANLTGADYGGIIRAPNRIEHNEDYEHDDDDDLRHQQQQQRSAEAEQRPKL